MLFLLFLLLTVQAAAAASFAPGPANVALRPRLPRATTDRSDFASSLPSSPAPRAASPADDPYDPNDVVVVAAAGEGGDADLCEIGVNAVDECSSLPGTQSQRSAATNLAKCICGAGSFALPHVFLEEGVLGGTVAITVCGALASYTMKSLCRSKLLASADGKGPVTSYVELAENALGETASKIVFALTLAASIGVCSTYLVFIGQTLESLSYDAETQNVVRQLAPDVSEATWEATATLILYPLSLLRNYGVFAFTSALGVTAVLGGIIVTLASGVFVDPGGGLSVAVDAVQSLPMWPESLAKAFGGSFGTIAYLFCVNFLIFPVINSMKEPREFGDAVNWAVSAVWIVNVIFAVLCLGFYGDDTQDLVLGNLDNGPYLSALKLLLCVDLLFTFPVILSSGRQILENSILEPGTIESDETAPARAAIVAGAVGACYGLAQIGGFGAVTNLVGGVAQGTLAFIMPPAIAVALARRNGTDVAGGGEAGQLLLGLFGVAVVSSVTYFTAVGMLQ